MRRSLFLLTLLLPAMTALPAAAGDGSALLADGRNLERVSVQPGPQPDQLVLTPEGGDPLTIAAADLLALDFNRVPGRPAAATVRMVNGDTVVGKLSFPNPRSVKVLADWGAVTIPLAACSALRLQEQAALPGTVTRDTLFLARDRVEGELQGIGADKIQFLLAGKPLAVDRSRVLSIALAPRPGRAEPQPGLLLALDLGGGERLTGRWVRLGQDVLTIRLDWGETLDIPLTSLARLEVRNGKLVYLSDLRPSDVRMVPFLDGTVPFQPDRSVSGRPLRLAGKLYRRGLGVHSRTELTYALDGGFGLLQAVLGIDDSVGNAGSVVYRVYGDDRMLFESKTLRGGDAPVDLKLPIAGVLLLRLEVDFADGGDAGDHANWADARLLRK